MASIQDIADHIAKHGLVIREHIGPEEFKRRYRTHEKKGFYAIEVERFILAEVG